MASNENGIYALIITPLFAAVAYLAKQLYSSPRQSELDAIRKERDALRAIVDETYAKAATIAQLREDENRKLREEIASLRYTVERREPSGGSHGRPRTVRTRGDDV